MSTEELTDYQWNEDFGLYEEYRQAQPVIKKIHGVNNFAFYCLEVFI